MHKPSHTRSVFRFRRFARAGWAAYSSMHREVTIGRLAVRVADCSLSKVVAAAALCMALAPLSASAQSDKEAETHTLAEVQISLPADSLLGTSEPAAVLTAEEIKQHNIHSVAELVALLPGIDVRTRGVGDAQADLSMRGGSFDQVILLLNGINITDAQTGHHTLDLPIDIGMVQRAELLSPAQLMARGIVAFCGAVNLVVDEEYADRLLIELSGGSFGTANATLLATHHVGRWSLTAAATYHRSDGYMPNTDYRHGSLFLQAARHDDHDDLHLQLGGQMKAFGSQAFYSTTYPDQFEATRTLVASVTHVHRFATLRLESALYGRLHADRFELFREGVAEPPAWYSGHNHHLGSLAGGRSRLMLPLAVGEAVAGIEYRREGIRSNVLGDVDTTLDMPFTKNASRSSATLFAGWHFATSRWNLQAVALGLYNSRFGPDYGFAADVEYRPLSHLATYLSLSRTYRIPTFTDLYYQGANQQANPDLGSEHSLGVDVGIRTKFQCLSVDVSAYYRSGSQIIDWVRRPEAEMWYSTNHSAVDVVGVDANATATLSSLSLRMAYSYCHVAHDAGEWISGSALEHLRHRMALYALWQPCEHLRLKAGLSYRLREGSWVDADGVVHPYGEALLLDAGAECPMGRVVLYVEGHNLLGTSYRDHGGVPMPGRCFMGGVRLSL